MTENSTAKVTSSCQEQRIAINQVVTLLHTAEWITVMVDQRPVMGYHPADRQTRNSVAVQLLSAQLVTLGEAMHAFGMARSSLRKAWHDFNQDGIRALVPKKSGPKQAWKLTTAARRLLLDAAYAHPDWKMSQIMDLVNQQLLQQQLPALSERHARRFLTFCGILPRPAKSEVIGPANDQLIISYDNYDLLDKSSTSDLDFEQYNSQKRANQEFLSQNEPSKAVYTATDRSYLTRLQSGIDSAFGGGFLVVPFLALVEFPKLITNQLADLPEGYYSTLQMSLNFFYLTLFGIATLEMVKMIVQAELGMLIGRQRSPGLTKLRHFLAHAELLKRASAFALAAASHQIRAGVVDWQVLFIDGHFIPYYGTRSIRKGYFTTHRMAIKGNQAYYANDRQGRPLFFLLVEANVSLTTILPEMVQRVEQIVGQQWAEWCLSVIFDRGGFSAQLFKKLDKKKVYWVTWLKAATKVWQQVYEIKEEEFKLYLLRLKKSKVKVKLYEWQVQITDYGSCRAIVLLDTKSGKRMVITTNDKKRRLDEIAELLLNRWSQENFFKVMLARYYLDYTPGYNVSMAQEEAQVDNPRLKELRRLKKRLQTMKRQLESQLSQKLLARKRDQVSLQRYKEDHDKRVRAIRALEEQIDRVKAELSEIPKKVPLSQVWGHKHEIANLERKVFLDVIKGLAFNAEEWLLELFSSNYQGKDVRQALLQVIFRGAVVQLVDGVLHVCIKPFDSPKVQTAALALCLELNKKKVYTLDKFHFQIFYQVLPRQ